MTKAIEAKDFNCNKYNPKEIRIEVVVEEDIDEVLSMLRTFFYKDEPLNGCIKLGASAVLDSRTKESLVDECSFKALNSQGEIIGVVVNCFKEKRKPDNLVHSYSDECED